MNNNELLLLHSKYENPIEIEQFCPGNGFNFSRIFFIYMNVLGLQQYLQPYKIFHYLTTHFRFIFNDMHIYKTACNKI